MKTSMQLFSKNLSDIRKERGWTQVQLAELADLGQMTISQYERGVRWPTKKAVGKLSKALGVEEGRLWFNPDIVDADLAIRVLQAKIAKQH